MKTEGPPFVHVFLCPWGFKLLGLNISLRFCIYIIHFYNSWSPDVFVLFFLICLQCNASDQHDIMYDMAQDKGEN